MIWKNVIGYEDLYEVSSTGEVRRKEAKVKRKGDGAFITVRGGVMKREDNGKGYLRAKLTRNDHPKSIMVHRLVAEAFIPNPEGKSTVNHKDGNKKNNAVENLEWCTQSENCRHAINNKMRARRTKIGFTVVNTETGEEFENIRTAAKSLGKYGTKCRSYLGSKLMGKIPNNTPFILKAKSAA